MGEYESKSTSVFAQQAHQLQNQYPRDIQYLSITVQKEKVGSHIRDDANTLYNYMISSLLLDKMMQYDTVALYPDSRTVKAKSTNSLHDYLQTQLWFEKNVQTKLSTQPLNSVSNPHIQFADMLAGVVQSYFEDDKAEAWTALSNIQSIQLYFKK